MKTSPKGPPGPRRIQAAVDRGPRRERIAHGTDMAPGKKQRWSKRVTEISDALDLEAGVFKLEDPRKIALSLKRSAERSRRRKTDPFRSAMSMLNFYINRAGKNLPARQRRRLEKAKGELRELYGRPRQGRRL